MLAAFDRQRKTSAGATLALLPVLGASAAEALEGLKWLNLRESSFGALALFLRRAPPSDALPRPSEALGPVLAEGEEEAGALLGLSVAF